VRPAFKLFDSEGLTLVNLLSDGSGALEGMRERARDLGMVLDEHLVRDAERARTELDTLSQVISANLTRAALETLLYLAVGLRSGFEGRRRRAGLDRRHGIARAAGRGFYGDRVGLTGM
jgi:hypothetical protein